MVLICISLMISDARTLDVLVGPYMSSLGKWLFMPFVHLKNWVIIIIFAIVLYELLVYFEY